MRKKILYVVMAMAFCWSFAAVAFAQQEVATSEQSVAEPEVENFVIHLGEQKTLTVFDSSKVSIGKPGVVDIKVIGKEEVVLTGKSVGITSLVFWDGVHKRKSVKVIVLLPLETLADDIRSLLADVENVKVLIVGDRIVVDGKLLVKEDLDRVKTISSAYGNVALNLTTLNRGEENVLVENFIKKAAGIPEIDVKIVGDTAFISGFVFGSRQKNRVLSIAKTQVEKVVDLTQTKDIMIETDVMFVQMEKSSGHNVGYNMFDGESFKNNVKVDATIDRTDNSWGSLDFAVQSTSTIAHALNVVFTGGKAKMLIRPHISTKSGEKGFFHSGGQMYFKVTGVQEADLKSVEYGLQLTLQPEFVTAEEIVSAVKIQVSVPISKSGSEDLNLDKFVTENTVACKIGQSIIVSGIVENLRNHFKGRTPVLGQIPILNLFFSKSTRDDSNKELIAVLTPRIMNYPKLSVAPNKQAHSEELQLLDMKLNPINNEEFIDGVSAAR